MNRQIRTTTRLGRMAGMTATLLVAAALASGCGALDTGDSADRGTSPTAAADPKKELLKAVPTESDGTYLFEYTDASTTMTGSGDPSARGIRLATKVKDAEHGITTNLEFLVVDKDTWVKLSFTGKNAASLPKVPAKWLKLDPAKRKGAGSVPAYEGADPGNTGPLLDAATGVKAAGSGKYTGTIDLTSGQANKALDEEQMTALGAAAKSVPFTATVGADGNLAELVLDVPAAGKNKAFQYVVKYHDFGTAPKLAAPIGSAAQAAPALVYEILGS